MSNPQAGTFYARFGGDPYFNMGFDEWLLRRASETPGSIFVRLYTWGTGTITFGYNQRRETALDWEKTGDTPVIRRITGGRALYHDHSELTYAVAASLCEGGPLSGPLSEVSGTIAQTLAAFLDRVGVRAEYVMQSSAQNSRPDFFHKAPCFASAAKYELVSGEGKVVASAQKRTSRAFLQHGSIKMRGVAQHPALNGVEPGPRPPVQPIDREAFSLAAQLFLSACEVHFGVQLVSCESDLSSAELRHLVTNTTKNALEKRAYD